MPTPVIYEEPIAPSERLPERFPEEDPRVDALMDRVHKLETEVAEIRTGLHKVGEMVVEDIQVRREEHEARSIDAGSPISVLSAGANVVGSLKKPWLILELLREMGSALKMYFDPRYRVRRSTQLVIPFLISMIAVNYLLFAQIVTIWIISPVFERVILAILIVLIYKITSREVARYRAMNAELEALVGPTVATPPTAIFNDADGAAHTRQTME
jgi:hypothetical protein